MADGGLLGVEHFDALDVVSLEGEAGEVGWVGLDEPFGDGVEFGHDEQFAKTVPRQRLRAEAESAVLECVGKGTGMGS